VKELKIFGVIVFFTLVTYWGVEPLAHSIFHPHVKPADFKYKDLQTVKGNGDIDKGKELVEQNCIACHGLEKAGHKQLMDNNTLAMSYGVVPPDLSLAGLIYNENFLSNFIKHPTKAFKLTHKFDKVNKAFPMPNYDWMSNDEVLSIVEYLKSVAPKKATNKEVFVSACGRCHDMKYAKITALTPDSDIKKYMGSVPPDLSMMIRSRSIHYLDTFINNPQKQLHGTAMPRVGLTEKAQEQVITYLEEVGDSKKSERETLGPWVIGFFIILSILSFLWKRDIWKEVK
jgi:ubiquinol-cytochrome c reductase cytochrome c1 subunit